MKILVCLLFVFNGLGLMGQSCSEDSLVVRIIGADEVDSNIPTEIQKNHVFINNDCPSNGKFLLHLVGTFDNPSRTSYFSSLAANHGFKVIVLKYKNNVPPPLICKASFNQECYSNFRKEVLFGEDLIDQIEVDVDNSIMNRLNKLLIYLSATYPTEGWEDILTEIEDEDWTNSIVSGHSQGGGLAAFLGKMYEVNRVLMFASPNDYSAIFSSPAAWVNDLSATPDSNYYALGNIYDEVIDYNEQYEIWEDMNLTSFSDSTQIDGVSCQDLQSRLLYTTYNVPDDSPTNHGAMIVDNFLPMIDGKPTFIPVWKYMLGICSTSTSTNERIEDAILLKAFPNPVDNQLTVRSSENIQSLEILNLSGQILKTIYNNNFEVSINLSSYHGNLFLKVVHQSGKTKLLKIIKN